MELVCLLVTNKCQFIPNWDEQYAVGLMLDAELHLNSSNISSKQAELCETWTLCSLTEVYRTVTVNLFCK
jgi:hypothetical protein